MIHTGQIKDMRDRVKQRIMFQVNLSERIGQQGWGCLKKRENLIKKLQKSGICRAP